MQPGHGTASQPRRLCCNGCRLDTPLPKADAVKDNQHDGSWVEVGWSLQRIALSFTLRFLSLVVELTGNLQATGIIKHCFHNTAK